MKANMMAQGIHKTGFEVGKAALPPSLPRLLLFSYLWLVETGLDTQGFHEDENPASCLYNG